MSRRSPFCRCFEGERKKKKVLGVESIPVDTVFYAREGCYTLKKIVKRFWEPSLQEVLLPGEARHVCRRVFWNHVGLNRYLFFTEEDRIPEFIPRKGEIAQDLGVGSPVFSWEEEKIKLAKLMVLVEQDMGRKLRELMVRSPANWDAERIKLAKRLIDLELEMSRKVSQLMVTSLH